MRIADYGNPFTGGTFYRGDLPYAVNCRATIADRAVVYTRWETKRDGVTIDSRRESNPPYACFGELVVKTASHLVLTARVPQVTGMEITSMPNRVSLEASRPECTQ